MSLFDAFYETNLDEAIGKLSYILDCLRVYKQISESGNCNDCGKIKTCEYKPQWGEMVRYNCPHHERKEP